MKGFPVSPRSAYPETNAGGFSRRDGTVQFYTRVRSLLSETSVVVDLGAGRGAWTEDAVEFRRRLRDLRGSVSQVIAIDIDPAVKTNPACDRWELMPDPRTIPLDRSSVDLIISDHTLEHIGDPEPFVAEVRRVLRPGGWLCARTPNRWGYIGLATNLVPNSSHTKVLKRAQPGRKPEDVFPTTYRMNSRKTINALFAPQAWEVFMYTHNPEPAYFGTSDRVIRVVDSVVSRLPEPLGATWHIFAQKKSS